MIELNLASFAGGTLMTWVASEYVMPMILGEGSSICINGGSGSSSGVVVTAATGGSTWATAAKLAVDGIAFFIGMMLGQYVAGRFMR